MEDFKQSGATQAVEGPLEAPLDPFEGEVSLPEARGRRAEALLFASESITPETLGLVLASAKSSAPELLEIRQTHHQLARLTALGKRPQEISLISGYSPAYISSIKNNKTFQELVEFYASKEEVAQADISERMRILGLTTLEEIQHRLELERDKFTKRELMDLFELLHVKPKIAAAPSAGAAASVQVNLKFVSPQPKGPEAGEIVVLEDK